MNDQQDDQILIHSVASQHLGPAFTSQRIGGGRNSSVFRLSSNDSRSVILKRYYNTETDPRDRLATEFSALQFMQSFSVHCVPRPIFCDKRKGYAIYEFIQGKRPQISEIERSDINQCFEFVKILDGLKTSDQARLISDASEACYSLCKLADNIGRRLASLQSVSKSNPALHDFLTREYLPVHDSLIKHQSKILEKAGINPSDEIPLAERTLSPSDFGFHNSIRSGSRLYFMDFEYFGWDDPVKLISDFLLHPAEEMGFSEELKKLFSHRFFAYFGEKLLFRFTVLYPLYGLKWSLILLNEFLPENLKRRELALGIPIDKQALRDQQLKKARSMLNKTMGAIHEIRI